MKNFFYCIFLIVWAFYTEAPLFGKDNKTGLRERVYVQTDKQLYLAGEPVLMKILTTNQELKPIDFSKTVYVELVADSVALLQIKVELTEGTGMGRMLLPVDLMTGYYRLIAYTQFMRNEGNDVFFEKNIAVYNSFQAPPVPPEGGETPLRNFTVDGTLPPLWGGQGEVKTDKTTYSTRARGELTINGLPDNIFTLSVSISGKELIPAAASNISLFQQNLLKKTAGNTITAQHNVFLPEYEGHIVTGKIINHLTGNQESDTVSLTSGLAFLGEGIRFFTGQRNETGEILFFTSGITGTKEIATIVYPASEKYRIDIQSPFISRFAPKKMPVLHIDSTCLENLLDRSVALQVFHYFAEETPEIQYVAPSNFKMKPTWNYPLDEYTRFATMREVFVEFIIGARFRNRDGKQELSVYSQKDNNYYTYGAMPLVLLDGVPVSDHNLIYSYDPLAVETINIYCVPYLFGGQLFDGIVELITYRRIHADLNLNKSTQILSYEGPQLPYQIYTPDYSNEKNHEPRIPDSRHTLLWNTGVRLNGKNSIRLPFDTSDLTGEFQVTVEGVTKDGEMIFATAVFVVE